MHVSYDDDGWFAEPRRPRRRRFLGRAIALLVLLVLVATVVWWPLVVAQARAVVVLADVLEVPVLDDVVHVVTDDPMIDEDARVAGVPTSVFRPGEGDGPWPTLVFITGADESGRRQRDLVRLGNGLARAGFMVIVPDLPGMREGQLGPATLDEAAAVIRASAELDGVRDDRVALGSVSAGASLALLLAADPDVERHVSVIAGVAPFAEARTVLEIAITGSYRHPDGRVEAFESTEWMRLALVRSLVAATDGPYLVEAFEQRVLRHDRPLDLIRSLDESQVRAIDRSGMLSLLRARDGAEFDRRYDALSTDVRALFDTLSPLRVVDDLDVKIELASAPRDTYFPLRESQELVAAAPDARLTVTGTLDHAIPRASPDELDSLAAFDGFVVRTLRAAAE